MSTSLFMLIMEAVRDKIQGLDLSGLPDNRVAVRRLPHDGEVYYAGITVHPIGETYGQGTNSRELPAYGVAITMVSNVDNDKDYNLDRILLWRETIRRAFVEDSSLTGCATVCTIKIEHGKVIDESILIGKNYDVSTIVARVYSLETRT
jgi:hypothetical protein